MTSPHDTPADPKDAATPAAEPTTLASDEALDSPESSPETNGFAALGLHPMLVRRLADGGYEAPTPIQQQAIPPLLAGRDVVGQAQTGTGKTAAFSLPLIQRLEIERYQVQALILCPTRELALQVTAALASYGESRKVRVLTVYGGTPIHQQVVQLRRGVHVVVGTPGRVKDCIERGVLSLATVREVVLDEADEMLRMGFIDDVEEILAQVPKERQTALFSATMPPAIQRVAAAHLRNPVQVSIERRTRTVERTEQRVVVVHASEKLKVLIRIIEAEPTDAVLVFARTRVSCAQLVDALRAQGLTAAALHGDLSQAQREEIVAQLRARKIQLVVATDIAARGLDVDNITHVINYDPPVEPDIYVHRIGRTGRAGRAGVSVLLVTPREQRLQQSIEQFTGQRMAAMPIPTNAELLAARTARLRQRIQETLAGGDLAPYQKLVDEILAEPDADPRQLAAALARLASGNRPLKIEEREPKVIRTTGTARREQKEGWARIFVTLGRQAGLGPGDIVGAIANEAGVPGRAVGAIDIREKVSFVEVAAEYESAILECMNQVKIRGRTVAFVAARPETHIEGRGQAPRGRFGKSSGPRTPSNKPSHRGKPKPWVNRPKKR